MLFLLLIGLFSVFLLVSPIFFVKKKIYLELDPLKDLILERDSVLKDFLSLEKSHRKNLISKEKWNFLKSKLESKYITVSKILKIFGID